MVKSGNPSASRQVASEKPLSLTREAFLDCFSEVSPDESLLANAHDQTEFTSAIRPSVLNQAGCLTRRARTFRFTHISKKYWMRSGRPKTGWIA